jgi:hypothetical protein
MERENQVEKLRIENELLRDLVMQRMAEDDMFFQEHPDEETIFVREWTEAAQMAMKGGTV